MPASKAIARCLSALPPACLDCPTTPPNGAPTPAEPNSGSPSRRRVLPCAEALPVFWLVRCCSASLLLQGECSQHLLSHVQAVGVQDLFLPPSLGRLTGSPEHRGPSPDSCPAAASPHPARSSPEGRGGHRHCPLFPAWLLSKTHSSWRPTPLTCLPLHASCHWPVSECPLRCQCT